MFKHRYILTYVGCKIYFHSTRKRTTTLSSNVPSTWDTATIILNIRAALQKYAFNGLLPVLEPSCIELKKKNTTTCYITNPSKKNRAYVTDITCRLHRHNLSTVSIIMKNRDKNVNCSAHCQLQSAVTSPVHGNDFITMMLLGT